VDAITFLALYEVYKLALLAMSGGGGGGGGGSSFVESTATNVSHGLSTRFECDASGNGCITISW
jgi:hypothetical protein